MVEKRKKLFTLALILTIVVFSVGVGIGLGLDYFRIKDLSDSFREDKLDMESFVVEQQFIREMEGGCDLLQSRVSDLTESAYSTGTKLEKYESAGYTDEEYHVLKRENMVTKVRLLMALEELEERCNESPNTIIFFYERNSNECVRQGQVLDELNREKDYRLSIFSFDTEFKREPLIRVLNKKYNVTEVPTLIVNGKVKEEGFTSKGKLESYF